MRGEENLEEARKIQGYMERDVKGESTSAGEIVATLLCADVARYILRITKFTCCDTPTSITRAKSSCNSL
jgi:hypothetical protein